MDPESVPCGQNKSSPRDLSCVGVRENGSCSTLIEVRAVVNAYPSSTQRDGRRADNKRVDLAKAQNSFFRNYGKTSRHAGQREREGDELQMIFALRVHMHK